MGQSPDESGMRLFSIGVENFEVHVEERREAKDWKADEVLRGLRGRYDAARHASAKKKSTVQSKDQSISLFVGKFCSWLCVIPHGAGGAPEYYGLSRQLIEDKCR
eukprot:3166502-Rhodomonas_salina.1